MSEVTEIGWIKGIAFSVAASIIGGASKLAIRKSWLMEAEVTEYALATSNGSEEDDVEAVAQADEDLVYATLSPCNSFEVQGASATPAADRGNRRIKLIAWALRLSGMIGMTFLNPLCCVLAMNYASPSILAPFSGLTLVWIILFSNPVIGEKPSRPQVIAASLIVMGEVIVAIFGDHHNDDDETLQELLDSYRDPYFQAYFVVMLFWMLLLGYWMVFGKSTVLRRFAWGAAGGSITGLQNFLKDSLTILKATKTWPWYLALTVTLAILSSFTGLLLLTACMKRYDATFSSASFVGSFVISASIMAAVHYKTFSNLDGLYNYILYPVGLIILIIGVYILVRETKESIAEPPGSPRSDDSNDDASVPTSTPIPASILKAN